MSPTARSLEKLRKDGYTCAVTEKWNAFSKTRQDLFGCIDLVGIHPEKKGVLGIQATSTANISARVTKSTAEPRLKTWLLAGNSFSVWGWSKKGKRGEKKTWTLTSRDIVLDGQGNYNYT